MALPFVPVGSAAFKIFTENLELFLNIIHVTYNVLTSYLGELLCEVIVKYQVITIHIKCTCDYCAFLLNIKIKYKKITKTFVQGNN